MIDLGRSESVWFGWGRSGSVGFDRNRSESIGVDRSVRVGRSGVFGQSMMLHVKDRYYFNVSTSP